MEIEMKNLQKEPANRGDSSNLIEHSTQEVGTVEELPRLYSTSGRYEDSYVGNFDTYGSYSSGMYGNHASLNYVFGNLGSTAKKTKPRLPQIQYDKKGTILNYTTRVVEIFGLKDKDGFMGDSVINLIDPAFVSEKGKEFVLHAFGLGESGSAEPTTLTESPKLTAVRANGDTFEMTVTINSVTDNVIKATLSDGSEPVIESRSRMASTSSFSSYADTLTHLPIYSTVTSHSSMSDYPMSQYGGLVVDMAEIGETGDEWIGTGHYCAGKEEILTPGANVTAAVSAVSLTAFSDLRRALENGVISLDVRADTLQEVVNAMLDEAEVKHLSTPEVREPLVKLFEKREESVTYVQESGKLAGKKEVEMTPIQEPLMELSGKRGPQPGQKEGCKVYVAKLSFLKTPIVAMVRLRSPIVVQEQAPLLIRYFLFVLGSKDCTSTAQLHEMGRAFSLMMSQNWFSNAARKVNTAHLFLKLMDSFMTRCTMLPPPDPLADNPFQFQSVRGGGCCGGGGERTLMVMMPNTTLQRANHQLRHRQRVLHEHDNLLKTEALQQEPTLEELEKEKTPTTSRVTVKDWVISGITAACCLLVLVMLLTGHSFLADGFEPYDDKKHVVPMLGYSMEMFGGLKSLTRESAAYYPLPEKPRGIYELRATVQASEEPYELTYGLWQKDASGESQLGENVTVVSAASTETESLKEMDVAKEVKEDAALFVKVTTNSSSPVAFVLHAEALTPLGRHRVLIGSIILIAVYVLLLLEVINRAVVAFIGAFLTLLLITFTSHAPALATVVGWMDSSTLCLLFGMMIMVQMLSTTGMFEYLAVMMLTLTKGNVLHLNMALCLLTTLCSAFLDNVTTMLLIAPVTIELSRMMNVNPVPFLLPEVIYSNIGGTATQIGDPPNLIIGNMLSEHIGFVDFIKHATPCVLICVVVVYPFVYWYYRDELSKPSVKVDNSLKQKYPIKNKPLLMKCGTVLATVILLFFLHSFHHIDTAYIAIAGAFACLLLGTNEDLHTTFELLEWETLVFFAGLFIMIEGVNEMGVIRAIGDSVAALIMKTSPRFQSLLAHMLILWVSGLASSVLDNIAFTATMIPIIRILGEHPELSQRMDIYTLAWALAFGACFGGNGTLVGAGANLVTAGISATNGHPISFGQFFKFGFMCMMITMIVSTIYVWIRYV